jgi:hypothetical protein
MDSPRRAMLADVACGGNSQAITTKCCVVLILFPLEFGAFAWPVPAGYKRFVGGTFGCACLAQVFQLRPPGASALGVNITPGERRGKARTGKV